LEQARRTRDAEDEVFEKVRRSLLAVRADADAISTLPVEDLRQMVGFVAAWGSKRRIARARALECLRILLFQPSCGDAVRADPQLEAAVVPLVQAEPALMAVVRPPPPPAPRTPSESSSAGGGCSIPRSGSFNRQTQVRRLLEGLELVGRSTRGAWTFPTCPLSTEFDSATDGFIKVFSSLQRLGLHPLRSGDEPLDVAGMLEDLGGSWLDLLSFLASMYRLEERKSLRSRVVETAHILWRLEPGFRATIETAFEQTGLADLPWLEAEADLWRDVAGAEAARAAEAARSSQALVRELAPRMFTRPCLCTADKCFRCGHRMGYILALRGCGWRQSTHDLRCLRRMLQQR